jgi:hypothetical protein
MFDSFFTIPVSSPEWGAWLRNVTHDFFHTAEHHRIWEEYGAGTAWLAVYGCQRRFVAWPYLLRRIETCEAGIYDNLYDVTSVYGYAGPLFFGCSTGDPFIKVAVDTIFEHWQKTRVVSVFTRFHPLLLNHSPICALYGTASCKDITSDDGNVCVRHEGHTVSMDLTLTRDEAWRGYRRNHRRDIEHLLDKGITAEVDQKCSTLTEFASIYYQTMRRNGADPQYYFSERYFERLCRVLDSNASIHIARLQGKAVAALLVTEFSGLAQCFLGGASDEAHRLSPLKFLFDNAREWARSRGNHSLHLGGGRGGRDDDSLFYFKAGFSTRRHCYYTGRWIVDEKWYDHLLRDNGQQSHETRAQSSYFPAYRANDTTVLDQSVQNVEVAIVPNS